ncbi:MAG: hypothetical protein ACOH17_01620 [Cellulomonas sp.]
MLTGELHDNSLSYIAATAGSACASRPEMAGVAPDPGPGSPRLPDGAARTEVGEVSS